MPTAMADDDALDGDDLLPGDEDGELVDRVVLELAEDARTSHLNLYVAALNGLVVLSGVVDDETDSEAAVAVAERVQGVMQAFDRTVMRRPAEAIAVSGAPVERPLEMAHVVTGSGVWRATVIVNQFRLRAEREQVADQIAALERDLQAYGRDQAIEGHAPTHNADLASDMAAAETIVAELELLREQAEEIDDALARVARGSYGICENCGRLIDRARLKALPIARYDIRCQELLEARGEV
jgi:DnaK suppressor protein